MNVRLLRTVLRHRIALLAATLTAVTATTVAGCAEDFEPYNELSGFRLLAVQADKPSLTEGDATQLEALTWGAEEVTYDWSWCPLPGDPSERFACPLDEAELGLPEGALTLGDEPTATLPYPGDAASLRQACEQLQRDTGLPAHQNPIRCDRGVTVFVRLAATGDGQTITAIKEVELLIDSEAAPNRNPDIELVMADEDPEPRVLDEIEMNDLDAGRDHRLEIVLAPGAAQTFTPLPSAINADPQPRREDLIITWFVSRGATDAARTGTTDDGAGADDALTNVWTLPNGDGEGDLIVVARDERGGVSWASRRIRLVR